MPRETIASVKRAHAKKIRELALDRERITASLSNQYLAEIADWRKRVQDLIAQVASLDAEKDELIAGHAKALEAKDAWITELVNSKSEQMVRARATKEEVTRLQAALSDASRVIAALGRRGEA